MGMNDNLAKGIEDALSEAMSDDIKNPTSRYNTLKGRNNPAKYGRKRKDKEDVKMGDVRFSTVRGKTY